MFRINSRNTHRHQPTKCAQSAKVKKIDRWIYDTKYHNATEEANFMFIMLAKQHCVSSVTFWPSLTCDAATHR